MFGVPALIFGCSAPNDSALYTYGSCMHGWIYYFKVNNAITDFASDSALAAEHKCTATGGCNLCAQAYNPVCWEQTLSPIVE